MSYKLGYIASYLEADLVSASGVSSPNEISESVRITGINNPASATEEQISFISSKAYVQSLADTKAAAVILNEELAPLCPVHHLIVVNPYQAYAKLTALFAEPRPESEIAPSAVVAASAEIGQGCYIGPNAVIGDHVVIGDGVTLGPGVSVGARAAIGSKTQIHANVSIYHDVRIGQDCIIHSGTVIGCDGFGFAPSADGYIKIHQLGTVIIGDRVEIGGNTSIDRGALGDTEIHDGVKIDNLVHIAHNCIIGENTALAGQVGMAGTTEIGKNCTFGGQVGLAGHLTIADSVHATGKAVITKSINTPGLYSSGTGFSDNKTWRKNAVRFGQLDELFKRVAFLEKKTESKD